MARRKKGNPVHGWLILDKPSGISSAQAVSAVRRVFAAQKAGHSGTLDPLATGILPIALGEATKTVPYVMDTDKAYDFVVRWGESRTTDDKEGDVLATSDVRPDVADIEAALEAFVGDIQQTPPQYSAIKLAGERAYDIARSGEEVALQPRVVTIHQFELVEMIDRDHARFHVESGKGAYMRALARDLALAVGSVGHIADLRRLRVGPFTEDDAISLDSLTALVDNPAAFEHLRPVETALDDIPALAITEEESFQLKLGRPIVLLPRQAQELKAQRRPREIAGKDCTFTALALCDGVAVALGDARAGKFQPSRVFNLTP